MEQQKMLALPEKGSAEYRMTICEDLCSRQALIFNPATIGKTLAKVQTMEQSIALTETGDMPTLLQMAHRDGNEDKTIALVALNIAALDEYLHLNNRLTQLEIDTVARDIVQVYGGALSFADINIILTNARRGQYGRFYERLGGADIMAWIDQYFNARLNECEARTLSRHDRSEPRYRDRGVVCSKPKTENRGNDAKIDERQPR